MFTLSFIGLLTLGVKGKTLVVRKYCLWADLSVFLRRLHPILHVSVRYLARSSDLRHRWDDLPDGLRVK